MKENEINHYKKQAQAELPDIDGMYRALVQYFSVALNMTEKIGKSEENERLIEVIQAKGDKNRLRVLYEKYIGQKIGSKIDKNI